MKKRLLVILFFLIVGNAFVFASTESLLPITGPLEQVFDFLTGDLVKYVGGILIIGCAIAIGFMGFSQLPGLFTLILAIGIGLNVETIMNTFFGVSLGFII